MPENTDKEPEIEDQESSEEHQVADGLRVDPDSEARSSGGGASALDSENSEPNGITKESQDEDMESVYQELGLPVASQGQEGQEQEGQGQEGPEEDAADDAGPSAAPMEESLPLKPLSDTDEIPVVFNLPDDSGHFGPYGGRFVAETLMGPLEELTHAYRKFTQDKRFLAELDADLCQFVGRPSPLYFAERWTKTLGGARIYLKREDLNHTGAHKINNTVAQAMLAKRMGKTRVIAETGAGQHGVATATVATRLGLECVVYMGTKDIERQAINVYRMKLLGAEVIPVTCGSKTLKDALNEALRDWVTNVDNTFYIIGTVAGPHPYPAMVRDFQAIIGRETRAQILAQEGHLPHTLVACVGGGSNAIGLFHPFLADTEVAMYGVESAGEGLDSGRHAATLCAGKTGVLHGNRTYLLEDSDGQIIETHSISAGLDYPGVGPEHAWLKDQGRVQYVSVTDEEAVAAFHDLTRTEGIMPALESSHALAYTAILAPFMGKEDIIVVNLSGRGDKDVQTIAEREGIRL